MTTNISALPSYSSPIIQEEERKTPSPATIIARIQISENSNKSVQSKVLQSGRIKLTQALKKIKLLYQGVSKGARAIVQSYQAEVFDPNHRYGRQMNQFFSVWKDSKTEDDFQAWMTKVDQGQEVSQREALKTQKLLKEDNTPIEMPKVVYLKENELSQYELQVDSDGNLTTEAHKGKVLHSKDRAKESSYMFVICPEGKMYAAPYERGTFNHSSFLAGKPVKCAGVFLCTDGKLNTIWDDSGHYNIGFYHIVGEKESRSHLHMREILQVVQSKGILIDDITLKINEVNGKEWRIREVNAGEFLNEQK
jgi:hypothetical protein